MKIEIAESLASSYLNHVEGCRIIQTNWKTSSAWKIDQRLFEEAEVIYERIKSSPDFINVFKSKRNTFKQFIKQAEIDVLGINTSELRVYGLDIAFHSAGLNYSSQSQTVVEIVLKKLFRTALIMKIYFEQYDSFESIFVSPKINPSVQKNLDSLVEKASLILNNPTMEIKVIHFVTFLFFSLAAFGQNDYVFQHDFEWSEQTYVSNYVTEKNDRRITFDQAIFESDNPLIATFSNRFNVLENGDLRVEIESVEYLDVSPYLELNKNSYENAIREDISKLPSFTHALIRIETNTTEKFLLNLTQRTAKGKFYTSSQLAIALFSKKQMI